MAGTAVANARDLGMTPGNSAAANTTAFNSAMSAAPIEGGVLFFPRGVYEFNGPLVIPVGSADILKLIDFRGEDPSVKSQAAGTGSFVTQATQLKMMNAASVFIDAGGPTDVSTGGTTRNQFWGGFHDLVLASDGGAGIGIHGSEMQGVHFSNVAFNNWATGLLLERYTYYARYDGLIFYSNSVYGAHFKAAVNGVKFNNFRGKNNGSTFFFDGVNEATVGPILLQSGTIETDNGPAVIVQDCYQMKLDTCYFEQNCQASGNADVFFTDYKNSIVSNRLIMDNCYTRPGAHPKSLVEAQVNGSGGNAGDLRIVLKENTIGNDIGGGYGCFVSSSAEAAKIRLFAEGNVSLINSGETLTQLSNQALTAFRSVRCRDDAWAVAQGSSRDFTNG